MADRAEKVEDEASLTFAIGGGVSVDETSTRAVFNHVIDTGEIALISKRGAVVAAVVPVALSQLVERYLGENPDIAAQITDAAAHPERGVPVDPEVFRVRDDPDQPAL